jgi:hypothetical protein
LASPFQRWFPTTLFVAGTSLLLTPTAWAVKREVIRDFQEEFAGHSYLLRVDLQGTNYLAAPNVVDGKGFEYRGRQFPVMFQQLEMVYLDRISNDGNKSVLLTVYRTKEDASQIRGAMSPAPFGPGPQSTETMLGSYARGFSTSVTLELQADKNDTAAQKEEIRKLLDLVFYIKVEPSEEERESFILSHSTLPLQKMMERTGLPEAMIRKLLEQHHLTVVEGAEEKKQ